MFKLPPAYIIAALAAIPLFLPSAFAANCFELANCDIDNFFDWTYAPWQHILGDFTLPLVWGFVVSLLYIKNQNTGLTITVGIFLMTGLMETSSYLNTNTNLFFFWGVAIAAVGFGCSLFYLFKIRVNQPA